MLFTRVIRGITTAKRGISTTTALRQPSLAQIKKMQADYQVEDGRCIWEKGGMMDRVLYTSTIVLCVVGFGLSVITIYDHAKPSSWKTATTC